MDIKLPDFRIEAGHLMGCDKMEEDTKRQEFITYLQIAYIKGFEKGFDKLDD